MGRTMDFAGVGDYEPAPAGQYTVELTGYEFAASGAASKNPGSEYVKAKLTVQDEVAADGTTAVQGKVIFTNWSLLPKALWRFKQDMIAFGNSPEVFAGEVDIEEILGATVGRKAVADVGINTYAYPEGHAKFGQVRSSNEVKQLSEAELPEVLSPGGRRR